ncbi:hypothetical protein [Ruminococcus sp. AM42-11]|uniref:hypothetical protein n=1 Tax=Ruminococcus sp. AM42-11 TaxID=2292372 RepID=UPI001FA9F019|nr:hypothetical protein [Ruminococcus sp. AM42-11]
MQKIDFNKDWICRCLTRDEEAYPVTLPHDAMLSEPRTQESTGEGNMDGILVEITNIPRISLCQRSIKVRKSSLNLRVFTTMVKFT